MTEEERKQLLERIDKRAHEEADENGNISFVTFLKLTKEFFGKYSIDNGKTFDEYIARLKETDSNASESEPESSNADDLPF